MASAKRASDGSNDDVQMNQVVHYPLLQEEDNIESAKLSSMSDTTLQDLPIELLYHILVKAVAMEVKGLKFARRVWKEKADPVISRLRTVCWKWNTVLTTNFFQNELNRTLNSIAQATIRLEILLQSPMQFDIFKMTSLKDEIFMLCNPHGQTWTLNVYDRNNMAEVKDVILLPKGRPLGITACNVSNCLYIEIRNSGRKALFKIGKYERDQFEISPWLTDHKLSLIATISASANGNLIVFSDEDELDSDVINIFDANGSLLHEIMLSPEIHDFSFVGEVMQKSNGNLVLASIAGLTCRRLLFEVDMNGKVVRECVSSLSWHSCVHCPDFFGRFMITDLNNGMELLDSEFNLLDFTSPQMNECQLNDLDYLHYNSERNEVICISDKSNNHGLLTAFRFTEE